MDEVEKLKAALKQILTLVMVADDPPTPAQRDAMIDHCVAALDSAVTLAAKRVKAAQP